MRLALPREENRFAESPAACSVPSAAEIVEPEALKSHDRMAGVADVSNQFESWPLRLWTVLAGVVRVCFGVASLWVVLAIVAAIPLVQFASFGYLLAVSGRVASGGRLRDGFIGWSKAAHLGGILLGGWISLLPARLISDAWYAAWLIDPESSQTRLLRFGLLSLVLLTGVHLVAALACGGKLRHFLWPLIAPLRWLSWLLQGVLRWRVARNVVDGLCGWWMPKLLRDLRSLRPLADWFPPFVLAKSLRAGNWWRRSSERLWEFWLSLRLIDYWWLGLRGAFGTLLWLLLPSGLLIAAANRNDPLGGFLALVGIPLAAVVFALLFQVQTRFAATGKWRSFLEPRLAWLQFRKAPFWSALSGWLALLLALPMFLLKIEAVPSELEWVLALVFVAGALPTRLILGWAAAAGIGGASPRRWWWSGLWACGLVVACGAFVVIVLLTRYLSWAGAGSIWENHLFLLPTPFWLQ